MKVEIYDQVYNVAGDLEPEYVEQLAKYVDQRMRQIARGTGAVDSIADELHALRQSREKSEAALRANAERCLKLIDRALQQSA
jgi:cell division protein ZapA (FtsZ GTPase activity inhibitor)